MAKVGEAPTPLYKQSMDEFFKMAKYPLIKHCDMTAEMREEAVDICITAVEKFPSEREKCTQVRINRQGNASSIVQRCRRFLGSAARHERQHAVSAQCAIRCVLTERLQLGHCPLTAAWQCGKLYTHRLLQCHGLPETEVHTLPAPGSRRVGGSGRHLSASDPAKRVPQLIKDTMDKKFGPAWQVVVGKGFSYDVQYEVRHFAHDDCVCLADRVMSFIKRHGRQICAMDLASHTQDNCQVS